MKTFRIFLHNGTAVEVLAAKWEQTSTPGILGIGVPALVFIDDSLKVVAEFRADALAGVQCKDGA